MATCQWSSQEDERVRCDVKVLMKDRQQVLRMLERVMLSDHMRKNKAEGKLMTKAEKIEFVSNWKLENK
jgi:hypothetical protein